jgi:hypothetical protein
VTYQAVENGLIAVIRKAAGFDTTNVSADDPRTFARGKQQIVNVTPGPDETVNPPGTSLRRGIRYTLNVTLSLAFSKDVSEIAGLMRTVPQTLRDEIDAHPTLDGTTGVTEAHVVRTLEIAPWQGEHSRWWTRVLEVQATQHESVTFKE